MEQRSSAIERSCRDDVDTFQFVSTIAHPALQPDCDCALARANLRLGLADFRMGAAGDLSLGGIAAPGDRRSREVRIRYFAFSIDTEKSRVRRRRHGFCLPAAPRSS